METAEKPMIACVDLDVLPVVDDEMEKIDLIHGTGVCWCKIHLGFVFSNDTYNTPT